MRADDRRRRAPRAPVRHPRRRGTYSGFTLIELLVAITVLAIVAVLGWRGLDSIIRARAAITENIEQTRGMQLTFAQLESDCAHFAPASLVAGRPTLFASGDRLLLVRTVFADDQPTRVQTVAYRFVNGQVTRQEWTPTRELRVLDASWRRAMGEADGAPAVVMQSGVSAMTLRTWTSDGGGWQVATGTAEVPRVSPAGAPVTATGLEVSLELREHPGKLVKLFLLGST